MTFAPAAALRAGLALAAGIGTGTVLAVLGVVGPADAISHTTQLLASLAGVQPSPNAVTPMWRVIIIAEWQVALTYSVIVGAVAAVIWYGMGRRGWSRLWHGLVLGAVLGAVAGGLVFYKSADGVSAELLQKIAVLAGVGAVAGLVTWLTGRPHSTAR